MTNADFRMEPARKRYTDQDDDKNIHRNEIKETDSCVQQ